MLHERVDAAHQLAHGAEGAAADRALRDVPEPSLHLVQPRGVRRREVHVVARPGHQPSAHGRVLVRRVVVDHQVHVQCGRHARVDVPEEAEELLVPVPSLALGEHLPRADVERGEEGGRAVPHVAVGHPLHVAQAHRHGGLRPLERLDLALLVDAERQRMVGRVEVQPRNVAHLLDEQRVGRQGEALRPVRLHAEKREVARDRALGDPRLGGHHPHAPVRARLRLRGEDRPQHGRDALVVVRAGAAAARRVGAARPPLRVAASAPLPPRLGRDAEARGDLGVRLAGRRGEDDLRPAHVAVRQGARGGECR